MLTIISVKEGRVDDTHGGGWGGRKVSIPCKISSKPRPTHWFSLFASKE